MDYDSQATISYSSQSQGRSRARLGRLRPRTSRRSTKKYPRYRQVTPYNTPYTFERNVEMDVYLNLSNGFNSRGHGLALVWSLSYMTTTFADAFTINTPIPGASELSTLFDQWRIDRVDTNIIYSASQNQVAPTTTNFLVLPVVNIVTDYDNNNANENLLEYPQCRTVQLGTTNGRPVRHTVFKPGSITQQEIIGAALEAPARVTRSPWIDCAVTDVPHYALKMSYAQFNPTAYDYNPDVVAGAIKLRCKIYYTCRNPR